MAACIKPEVIFAQLLSQTATSQSEVMLYVLIHLFLHESCARSVERDPVYEIAKPLGCDVSHYSMAHCLRLEGEKRQVVRSPLKKGISRTQSALSKRCRSSGSFARPNIERLTNLSLCTWASTGPLL